MTHDDTMVLVARLSRELPTILPGVTFQRLPYCDWLAGSELWLVASWPKGSSIPWDYMRRLHGAFAILQADFPWEVIHHHGDVETAVTEILGDMATYVSSAPIVPQVIYWGCCVVGQRIAFVYCRPGQVAPAFLPASPLTQEST